MIIVRIWEGLGNQLFQYAYARALQLRTGEMVCLDASRIYKEKLEDRGVERRYALNQFNTKLPLISNISNKYFFLSQSNFMQKTIYWMAEHHMWFTGFYKEEDTLYKENLKSIYGNLYLMGWFQNEKYFLEYRNILLKELTPTKKIKISQLLKSILKNEMTISVHVRRGDFKKNNNVLPVSYYKKAKEFVETKVSNPCYIIFSDDTEWVKKNLDFGLNVVYMCEEGLRDYEELLVMSCCKHNIIANSTFSWWGAWLNKNEDKIVVGPMQWFNQKQDVQKYNIMPDKWIRI